MYEAQPAVESLDGTRMLRSETLGLDLLAGRGAGELHFRDTGSGERLLGHKESEAARRAAEARAEAAELRAGTAEARVAELEALLGLRRG